MLDRPHLVLGDHLRLLTLALDGNQLGHRYRGDHHPGGVDGVLAAQALQPPGGVDHLPGVRIEVVCLPKSGSIGVPVPDDAVALGRRRVQALVEGRLLAEDGRRHELRQLVAHPVLVPVHPGGVAYRLLALDGGEGDDLRHMVRAVPGTHVVDDLSAVALVEVDVDVGHGGAAGIEEPLEDQPVLQGIDLGDLQAVGDHRTRRRAPARSGPDATVARLADQVPDDQEVGLKAHLPDHSQLVPDPLGDFGGSLGPVAAPGAAPHQFFQIGGVGMARRCGEVRQEEFPGPHAHIGSLGHNQRVVAGARIQI